MEARLPAAKRDKTIALLRSLDGARHCSLRDIQQVTGLLNFVSKVIPLGRTFCRRLYDAEQCKNGAPNPRHRIKVTAAMRADLRWWLEVLPLHTGIRVLTARRTAWTIWTDAAGTKGLGGFILPGENAICPTPDQLHSLRDTDVFSARVRSAQRKEHINVKEMLAVLKALTKWRSLIGNCRVRMFCDNTPVVAGLQRKTTRGRLMTALRKVLLQAAVLDIEIEPLWLSSSDNFFADALSRFDIKTIAEHAPQIKLLTRDYPPGSHTSCTTA